MLLKEIANIRPGYIFRKKPDYTEDGNFRMIRIQDAKEDNTINWDSLTRVNLEQVKEDNLIRKGDILFKSRGDNFCAVEIEKTVEDVIAISQFFIIRPKDNILSGYLAWYINQHKAQQYIAQKSVGTAIKHLSKQTLGELKIPVPDLEMQQRLIEIYKLRRKEKSLAKRIQEKREQLINAVMLKKIGGY